MIKTNNIGILEAIRELKEMSLSKRLRLRYEAHQKYIRDQMAREDYVRDEGIREGMREGLRKGELRGKIAGKLEGGIQATIETCQDMGGNKRGGCC